MFMRRINLVVAVGESGKTLVFNNFHVMKFIIMNGSDRVVFYFAGKTEHSPRICQPIL